MASEDSNKSPIPTKEEFDVIQNRIAMAFAKREALIKSWTAKSARAQEPQKTDAELEKEDAKLFRPEPPYLGVGAPIPSHFLVSDAERNNKSLRARFFPKGGLKASKARDAEEKAVSSKRGLDAESSDEEEGRSGLGKAKKQKTATSSTAAAGVEEEIKSEIRKEHGGEPTVQSKSLATPPSTPERENVKAINQESMLKQTTEQKTASSKRGISNDQTEVRVAAKQEVETSQSQSTEESKREKLKEKRRRQRKAKNLRKEKQLIEQLAVDAPEWLD